MLSNPTASFSSEIIFFWMKFKSNPKSPFLCKGEGRKCKTCSPPPKSISLAADKQNHPCSSWDSLPPRCKDGAVAGNGAVAVFCHTGCEPQQDPRMGPGHLGKHWNAGAGPRGALGAPGATTVHGHLALCMVMWLSLPGLYLSPVRLCLLVSAAPPDGDLDVGKMRLGGFLCNTI